MSDYGTSFLNSENVEIQESWNEYMLATYENVEGIRESIKDEFRDDLGNIDPEIEQILNNDNTTNVLNSIFSAMPSQDATVSTIENLITLPPEYGAAYFAAVSAKIKPSSIEKNLALWKNFIEGTGSPIYQKYIADSTKAALYTDISQTLSKWSARAALPFAYWHISSVDNPGAETVRLGTSALAGRLASSLIAGIPIGLAAAGFTITAPAWFIGGFCISMIFMSNLCPKEAK